MLLLLLLLHPVLLQMPAVRAALSVQLDPDSCYDFADFVDFADFADFAMTLLHTLPCC
jgi:hypothetical protein